MKKFLYLLTLAFSFVAFSACKDTKPEFTFDLQFEGQTEVVEQHINGSFDVNVTNEHVLALKSTQNLKSIEGSEGADALKWLNNYVDKNVVSEFEQAKAIYTIHVKGYVYEKLTGITFSVDKTYTNKETLVDENFTPDEG
jgi:hypothetical protein